MSIRHVAVVLNGRAGALLGRDAGGAMAAAFADAGLTATFIPADTPLPDRIVRAIAIGADAVVVAGGDGTIAAAAQLMAGEAMPLGVLPFGTMNLFAKDLGLPVGDVAAALRVIAAGHVRAVDAGDVNGYLFLCGSMLGLPVRLGRHREETRGAGLLGWLRMARAALRLLIRGAPVKGRLEMDGVTRRLRATTVTVTVNAIDAASGLSFSRPSLDAGELELFVIKPKGLGAYLRLALNLLRGRWREDRAVRTYRVETAVLHKRARGIKVMNDGEIRLIAPPLVYRIRKRVLLVLAP